MKRSGIAKAVGMTAVELAVLVGAAIAFGGPRSITPMASINDPFGQVDFSNMPPLRRSQGADGVSLALS